MQNYIKFLFFTFLFSTCLLAEDKKHLKEKPLTIKTIVVKMQLDHKKMYRLELQEFAAVYHAEERFADCLKRSVKENRKVSLVVSSQSLIIRECKVD